MEIKYPNIEVQLTGNDGNAFVIMGSVQRQIKRQGVTSGHFDTQAEANEAGNAYVVEAQQSESYDALLQHAMRTVTVF
jgi:hypothetical protein